MGARSQSGPQRRRLAPIVPGPFRGDRPRRLRRARFAGRPIPDRHRRRPPSALDAEPGRGRTAAGDPRARADQGAARRTAGVGRCGTRGGGVDSRELRRGRRRVGPPAGGVGPRTGRCRRTPDAPQRRGPRGDACRDAGRRALRLPRPRRSTGPPRRDRRRCRVVRDHRLARRRRPVLRRRPRHPDPAPRRHPRRHRLRPLHLGLDRRPEGGADLPSRARRLPAVRSRHLLPGGRRPARRRVALLARVRSHDHQSLPVVPDRGPDRGVRHGARRRLGSDRGRPSRHLPEGHAVSGGDPHPDRRRTVGPAHRRRRW